MAEAASRRTLAAGEHVNDELWQKGRIAGIAHHHSSLSGLFFQVSGALEFFDQFDTGGYRPDRHVIVGEKPRRAVRTFLAFNIDQIK